MYRTLLWIGMGGFLGSIARYLTGLLFAKFDSFPFGTFVANVLGCFLIGMIYGWSSRMDGIHPNLILFFATGFCGGYTTFSTFTFENLELLQSGSYLTFGLYTALSFLTGLLAVVIGLMITKI